MGGHTTGGHVTWVVIQQVVIQQVVMWHGLSHVGHVIYGQRLLLSQYLPSLELDIKS